MIDGSAPAASIQDNLISTCYEQPKYSGKIFLKQNVIREESQELIERFSIKTQSEKEKVSALSGGNIQKVVLARELSGDPQVIIADQPTRGVDVGATEFIRKRLVEARDAGNGVILVTSDLNEVLGLSDSLLVFYEGRIAAYIKDTTSMTEEELGTYMLGIQKQTEEEIREACHEQ